MICMMLQTLFVVTLLIIVHTPSASEKDFMKHDSSASIFPANATKVNNRSGKILNMFSVVRFPNGRCVSSTSGRNGTCYSAEECGDRGGDASGECAGGYGVCCVFEISCGSTSSENCTYFVSTGGEVGAC